MFFSKSNNQDILSLLNQVEAFIQNDLNAITKSNNDSLLEDEVYKKIYDIAMLLEQKQREDITIYGEIMLSSEKLSDGITTDIIQKKSSNEKLNYIAKSLNTMISKLNKVLNETCTILEEYSNQNYTNQINHELFRDGKLKELLIGINFLNDEITKNLSVTYRTSLVMQKESETLLNNSSKLSNDSNTQAVALEEVAASIEEITSSVQLTSSTSSEMSLHGENLKDSISSGVKLAHNTVEAMDDINHSTKNVQNAIEIIDQIAFQTNILSLNAAVEAATAGEAGKGFAVVAQEVRNLATKSAEAAKDIKELVTQANDKANHGKTIADEMIQGYDSLQGYVNSTIVLIQSVVDATKEQELAISMINNTVSQIDTITQENAAIAEDVRIISNQMNKVSNKNVELTSNVQFKGKDEIGIREKPYDTRFQGNYRRASDETKGLI